MDSAISRKWEHCRMCGLHKTYGDLLDLTADGKTYVEFLEIFGYLKIDYVDLSDSNPLPKTVCERCYDAIQDASKFFHTINKSQYILKNMSKSYRSDNSMFTGLLTPKEKSSSVIHEAINNTNESDSPKKYESLEAPNLSLTQKPALVYCRFCALQKPYWELTDFSEYNVFVKYERLLGYFKPEYIDLHVAKLPKICCMTCNNSLEKAYTYFNHVQESQQMLEQYYGAAAKSEPATTTTDTTQLDESTLNSTQTMLQSQRSLANPQNVIINQNKNVQKLIEDRDPLKDIGNPEESLQISQEGVISYQAPSHSYQTAQRLDGEQVPLQQSLATPQTLTQPAAADLAQRHPHQNGPADAVNDVEPLQCCTVAMGADNSWTSYPWRCGVCGVSARSVDSLRAHGKAAHGACAVTVCADCQQPYGCYNEFITHVRGHRDMLKAYCEYCNMYLPSASECEAHVATHWIGTQNICELCGEILPFANTLEWHRRLYGREGARGEYKRKKDQCWDHYPWACHECGFVPASLSTLRQHCTRTHSVCLSVTCTDCGKRCKDYNTFIDHARGHRPHLRHFCQYCNESFDDVDVLNEHVVEHITSQQRPCHLCGQIFDDNKILAAHKKQFAKKHRNKPQIERKYQTRNGGARKRKPKQEPEVTVYPEDLKCALCGKVLQSRGAYKRHGIIHQKRERNFVCSNCGKAFLSRNTLKQHVKTHNAIKTEVCQVCQKRFHTRPKLKAHILTHSELRPFVCDTCGASFKLRRRLKSHMKSHSDEKPFKCSYCYKEFKFKENLKTHEYQHTGERPYCCEFCERTFTNWTNCNKHMIRKHGVTLARTKITSQGRVAVDRRTGEAARLPTDEAAAEWISQTLQPDKRQRRPSHH